MELPPILRAPPISGGYYRFGQKYRIGSNGVFVFGSNLRGAHGAGTALYAAKVFGAQYGKGEGFSTKMQRDGRINSRCYALPTKDYHLRVRPLDEIEKSIDTLKEAMDMNTLDMNPHWFYITPVGTGLAGYPHEDIAPLFTKNTSYCWFPDIWKPYLGDLPHIDELTGEQHVQ